MDLADGSLQKQYEEYRKRLKTVEMVALSRQSACRELEEVLCDVKKDLQFIHSGIVCTHYTHTLHTTHSHTHTTLHWYIGSVQG